jgi:hypothetical protein
MHDVRYATFSEKGTGCNKNVDIKFSEHDVTEHDIVSNITLRH